MEEIWKIYKDTRNNSHGFLWEVSNFGNVKKNGEIYKPKCDGKYLIVAGERLHRIVAEMFIPNIDNKPCIDHIDGNHLNNNVNNLRWCTHKENNNNPVTKQRLIDAQKRSYSYQNRKGWNYDHSGENNPRFIDGRTLIHSKKTKEEWYNCLFNDDSKNKRITSLKKTINTMTPEERKQKYGHNTSGKNNGMFGNGQKISNEKNGRAIKVVYDGVEYNTIKEFCDLIGIKENTFRQWKTFHKSGDCYKGKIITFCYD